MNTVRALHYRLFLVLLIVCGLAFLLPRAEAATVRGTTTTKEGKKVSRVHVTIKSNRDGIDSPTAKSAVTDDLGQFQFDDIPPGTYGIVCEKQRWSTVDRYLTITDQQADETAVVNVEMSLTLLTRVLGNIQVGALYYVAVFGILILMANFYIAPQALRSVTVGGWLVVLVSISIAWVKLDWSQAIALSISGVVLGALVQILGTRVSARRVFQQEEERQERETSRLDEAHKIQQLIGKEGQTLSDLKLYGTAQIDGQIVSVRALHGFIAQDTSVVVRMVQGLTPIVESREPY